MFPHQRVCKNLFFLIPATYLASILLLQTVAVFLTVIYLDMYFRPVEKPVPRWVQTFASCLARIVCAESCCKSREKISPNSSSDVIEINGSEKHNDKVPPIEKKRRKSWFLNDNHDDVTDDVDDDDTNKYSWKDIALMLDKLTMYIYLLLVISFTGATFTVMVCNYSNSYA